MPVWYENMTPEDYERNHREWIKQEKVRAYNLRQRAKALLKEADEIDAMFSQDSSTANSSEGE